MNCFYQIQVLLLDFTFNEFNDFENKPIFSQLKKYII